MIELERVTALFVDKGQPVILSADAQRRFLAMTLPFEKDRIVLPLAPVVERFVFEEGDLVDSSCPRGWVQYWELWLGLRVQVFPVSIPVPRGEYLAIRTSPRHYLINEPAQSVCGGRGFPHAYFVEPGSSLELERYNQGPFRDDVAVEDPAPRMDNPLLHPRMQVDFLGLRVAEEDVPRLLAAENWSSSSPLYKVTDDDPLVRVARKSLLQERP